MTKNLLATCILSMAFASVGVAQDAASSPAVNANYTRAQVKVLAHSAHSPEQYTALASYFGRQHDNYLKQALQEKKEWLQLSQGNTSMAAKYPRPADSARNLYAYYMSKASEAGNLEAKYSSMASPNALVNAQ